MIGLFNTRHQMIVDKARSYYACLLGETGRERLMELEENGFQRF